MMTDDDKTNIDDPNDLQLEEELADNELDIDDDIDDNFDDDEFSDEYVVPKKSGNKFILFLLVILIAIGGAGYLFLGKSLPFIGQQGAKKSSSKTALSIPPAPNIANQQANSAPIPLPPPPMPTPIGPDTGTVTNIDNIDQTDGIKDIALDTNETAPIPVIEDMAADTNNIDTTTSPVEPIAPAIESVQDTISDISNTSVAEGNDTKVTAKEPPLSAPNTDDVAKVDKTDNIEKTNELVTEEELLPATPALQQISSTSETDQRIIALEQKIQLLTDKLNEVSNTEKEPAVQAPSIDKEKLDTLSQQMLQVTHRLDQLGDKIGALKTKSVTKTVKSTPEPKKPVKKAPKPSAKTKKMVRTTAKPTPKNMKSWILRSAQPGVAWLSKANGSEMQRYSVGQTIPKLGKIQSISQENGKWVVRTSGGVIKQ